MTLYKHVNRTEIKVLTSDQSFFKFTQKNKNFLLHRCNKEYNGFPDVAQNLFEQPNVTQQNVTLTVHLNETINKLRINLLFLIRSKNFSLYGYHKTTLS